MRADEPTPVTTDPGRRSDRGPWIAAWAVSLLLHVVAVLGFPRMPSSRFPAAARDTIPISLVDGSDPHLFTELPKDRADEAPKQADFVSDVTSRARDRVPGGEEALPRLAGNAEDPSIGRAPGDRSAASGAERSVLARPGFAASRLLDPGIASAEAAPSKALGATGGSRASQSEGANPGGNALLDGDISLNTTEWNYAPWLERFRDRLMSRWYAPEAYYLGILKDGGWGMFEVEITRAGKMIRFRELAEDGHPTLAAAAGSALHNVAPIEPLPADFPESTLVLRVRMSYPKIRPR